MSRSTTSDTDVQGSREGMQSPIFKDHDAFECEGSARVVPKSQR